MNGTNSAVESHRSDRETPHVHFEKVAIMWSTITGHHITAGQVCLCMMALKIVRESFKHHGDNILDIGGYAACLDEVAKHHKEK